MQMVEFEDDVANSYEYFKFFTQFLSFLQNSFYYCFRFIIFSINSK